MYGRSNGALETGTVEGGLDRRVCGLAYPLCALLRLPVTLYPQGVYRRDELLGQVQAGLHEIGDDDRAAASCVCGVSFP